MAVRLGGGALCVSHGPNQILDREASPGPPVEKRELFIAAQWAANTACVDLYQQ